MARCTGNRTLNTGETKVTPRTMVMGQPGGWLIPIGEGKKAPDSFLLRDEVDRITEVSRRESI